ncbi:MAG: class I SAM-dependent methyltransferase [Gemmatimonadota bacterium]
MAEWFEDWFGEDYLKLYPHRNDADAERMVSLIVRILPWQTGWRVLDVGCGAGRHARPLHNAGARVTGLDLSMSLLRRAQHTARVPLVRADMRSLPIRPASMDLTVNLFTSFGYFSTDREHDGVIAGMVETLRPNGWFAMDFLNARSVRDHLVAENTMEVGGQKVRVTRRLSDGDTYVLKTIEPAGGQKFIERVRLFEPEQLVRMLESHGAAVLHRFGDYDAGPLTDSSARCILFARRS